MCIQPKDEIKEPPAYRRRRINYKEHGKSTSEGLHKNPEKQIPLVFAEAHIHVYILKN